MLQCPLPPATHWCLVLLAFAFVGCGDEVVPDLPEGRYEAHISGGMVDTLEGPAHFRRQERSLIGVELGLHEGPGFSLELGPEPLQQGTYEVVEAELIEGPGADSLKGVFAFLHLGNARFEAVRGSLSVTHANEEEVRGTFQLQMDGYATGSPDDLSIRVEGGMRAVPE